MVGIISVVIGDHFGGGDHFDGGDHFGGGTRLRKLHLKRTRPASNFPVYSTSFSLRNTTEFSGD